MHCIGALISETTVEAFSRALDIIVRRFVHLCLTRGEEAVVVFLKSAGSTRSY